VRSRLWRTNRQSCLAAGFDANEGSTSLLLTLPDVIVELGSDIEVVHLEVTFSLAINVNSRERHDQSCAHTSGNCTVAFDRLSLKLVIEVLNDFTVDELSGFHRVRINC
jgi:hypothetical protein